MMEAVGDDYGSRGIEYRTMGQLQNTANIRRKKVMKRYQYGTPFNTEAITVQIEATEGNPKYGKISMEEGFSFTYLMD